MTPSGSGPRSTAVRRRVASGCLDHDHGRTRYVVGRLTRRQLRSWTVRLRAAHLLVAGRLGEWWDDALACLPAGAESGGPTGPSTRRGWVAGATEHEPSGAPSRHTRAVAFRPSAVRATPPARVPNCEGETSPLLTALMTTESAISGRNSFLGGCRCGRPRTPVRSGRVDHGGSAYQQPPPGRDSPPYRRRPRCTPGGGGVGPPRRLSSATSRAAVSRACASADTGSRPRPSSVGVRCAAPSPCNCSAALWAAAAWAARCWFSPWPTNRVAVIATAAARSPWPACDGGGTRPHSSRAARS